MANQVPEKLINFRVYDDGNDLLGVADCALPNLEAMTETVSGAGIAGEVDSPVLGHYGSMTATINFRTITKSATRLAAQRAHSIEFRGSQQVYDAGNGEYKTVPIKVATRLVPKTVTLGNLNVGAQTETSNEFEVLYLKVWLDGEVQMEIDKYNYIARVGEVDYLASVRHDLGL